MRKAVQSYLPPTRKPRFTGLSRRVSHNQQIVYWGKNNQRSETDILERGKRFLGFLFLIGAFLLYLSEPILGGIIQFQDAMFIVFGVGFGWIFLTFFSLRELTRWTFGVFLIAGFWFFVKPFVF